MEMYRRWHDDQDNSGRQQSEHKSNTVVATENKGLGTELS